ncbi:putative zinc-binding metallopeptidase [uncultured Sphingomonas sp.]|uniref:zinc-binding metallopeptidase family protein n=1 Tax=uncultured Sphingomonas sp. TaxID=158754 RepID=UPI0035C9AEB9
MSSLSCPNCHRLLASDSVDCRGCGRRVGFEPGCGHFHALDPDGDWYGPHGRALPLKPCGNAWLGVCNWLVADDGPMCAGCKYNRVIPDLTIAGTLRRWTAIEIAKKQTIHALIRLGIPPLTRAQDPRGLVFDFLYDPAAEQGLAPSLTTGHQSGLVTVNLIEADGVARERARRDLGEPYRTLVGHFRHELGHYYWHRLVEFTNDLLPFRALFGDERVDYAAAQRSFYAQPGSSHSQDDFVSRYATMHPWEDFAETFAHYLHIVDTLDTIGALGVSIDFTAGASTQSACVAFDPFTADTATLIEAWVPLSSAVNAINRSMGQPDLYPFRITPQVALKIDFVNRLLAFGAGRWSPGVLEQADLKAMIATLGHRVELHG